MELNGETLVQAPVQTVWDGLNNVDALAAAIPGCRSITEVSENNFDVVAKVVVGPVKATFRAKIGLTDMVPPNSYVMNFKSNGGVAGVANGSAKIVLEEEGAATRLRYNTDVQMGGKLTQIGSRLIESTADKMSAEFFGKFSNYLLDGAETKGEATDAIDETSGEQLRSVVIPEAASSPGMTINIRVSTLVFGIVMFALGFYLGYVTFG